MFAIEKGNFDDEITEVYCEKSHEKLSKRQFYLIDVRMSGSLRIIRQKRTIADLRVLSLE